MEEAPWKVRERQKDARLREGLVAQLANQSMAASGESAQALDRGDRPATGPDTVAALVARRVRAYAALVGATHAELAALLGVNPSTMSRWFSGETSIEGSASGRPLADRSPVERMAELLGVTPEQLVSPGEWKVGPK